MPIDPQSIEKRDFPIARRGYDIVAVDEHLGRISDEVEELRRVADRAEAAPPAPAPAERAVGSIAAAAAEQVRTIVEAAESTASEIERQARGEAARITGDADTAARRQREEAGAEASQHVAGVREATERMMQRVEALQGELGSLVEELRTSARRVSADLQLLEGQVGELGGERVPVATSTSTSPEARGASPEVRSAPAEPAAPVADPVPAPQATGALPVQPPATPEPVDRRSAEELIAPTRVRPDGPDGEPAGSAPAPAADPVPAPQPSLSLDGDDGEDDVQAENARLIVLNMALNGEPRDTALAYLRENFHLANPERLLDEVYAEARGEAA